jgi:ZIP family zinc transporter
MDPLLYAIAIATLAGSATGIGGLITLILKESSDKIITFMLGFASGTMIAVASLILLIESINISNVFWTGIGFALGALVLLIVDSIIPHFHVTCEYEGGRQKPGLSGSPEMSTSHDLSSLRCGLLVALGITLHNFPEGLSVATGFAITPNLGLVIALSIGFHNIPEGMAVAIPLYKAGMSKGKVFVITLLSGLSEPLAATISLLLLLQVSLFIQALFLAIAGGAMIYLVCDELAPQAHRAEKHEHIPTIGLVVGFLIILLLKNFIA